MRLLGEWEAARNRARVVSQQGANEILLLLNAALEIGNFFACCVHELFSLANVQFGCIAVIGEDGGEAK